MSDDSWSAELRQASGGVEMEEASAFLKRAQGGMDESARFRNEQLLGWLQSEGVWLSDLSGWNQPPHALALATSTIDEYEGEDSGRGLLARRAIVQDQELIRLPKQCCMTKQAALESSDLAGIVSEKTNEYIAIALLLLSERAKGGASYWAPYVSVLPSTEDISPTFAWDDDDLALLEGSPCLAATRSMQAKLMAEHAEVVSKLPTGAAPFAQDFADWQWAFSILFSRAIRLGSTSQSVEVLGLVPYVDFINHSPFSSSYVSLDSKDDTFLSNLFSAKTDDEVVVFADRSYKKFEQIFISYGPKSNSDLLLLYGFALDRNPFNSVAVRLGASADDPLYKQKIDFANAAGRAADGTESFPLYADRFADEMLQFLRMICLTKADLAAANVNSIDAFDFSTIISSENERAVLETIRDACGDALRRYDTNTGPGPDVPKAFLTRKQRMAARLVATEKSILKRTIDAASRKTADLVGSRV